MEVGTTMALLTGRFEGSRRKQVRSGPRRHMSLAASRRRVPDLAVAREQWREKSQERGWRSPSDWWSPEVDQSLDTLLAAPTASDAEERLSRLGAARAQDGVGLLEALGDVAALWEVLGRGEPEQGALIAVVRGWVEACPEPAADAAVDALTDLGTQEYLRLRLREVYEESEYVGQTPGDHHALVVIDLDSTDLDGWDRATALIEAAECLRLVYSGGQSLVRLGSDRLGALVPQSPVIIEQVEVLVELIEERLGTALPHESGGKTPAIRWHIVDLPRKPHQALAVLARLAR